MRGFMKDGVVKTGLDEMDDVQPEESTKQSSGNYGDDDEKEKVLDLLEPKDFNLADPLHVADLQYANDFNTVCINL